MDRVQPFRIEIYQTLAGREPFTEWLDRLKDRTGAQRIQARIARMASGNLGDQKPVGAGVYDIRVFHGPGYRIYFAKEGQTIILLLRGGGKKTQQRDIERAKAYRKEYRERKNGEEPQLG